MKDGKVIETWEPEVTDSRPCVAFAADFVGFASILECKAGTLLGSGGSAGGHSLFTEIGAPVRHASNAAVGSDPLSRRFMGSPFGGQQCWFALVSDLGVIKAQAAARASRHLIGEPNALDVRPGTEPPPPRAEA